MAEPEVAKLHDAAADEWRQMYGRLDGVRNIDAYEVRWNHRRFRALLSQDNLAAPDEEPDWRWHVSVSDMGQPNHPPKWADYVAVVHAVRPGVVFCAAVPPRSMWMNLHPGTLHAFEVRDRHLTEHWRQSGQAARAMGVGTPT